MLGTGELIVSNTKITELIVDMTFEELTNERKKGNKAKIQRER